MYLSSPLLISMLHPINWCTVDKNDKSNSNPHSISMSMSTSWPQVAHKWLWCVQILTNSARKGIASDAQVACRCSQVLQLALNLASVLQVYLRCITPTLTSVSQVHKYACDELWNLAHCLLTPSVMSPPSSAYDMTHTDKVDDTRNQHPLCKQNWPPMTTSIVTTTLKI